MRTTTAGTAISAGTTLKTMITAPKAIKPGAKIGVTIRLMAPKATSPKARYLSLRITEGLLHILDDDPDIVGITNE